MTCVLSTAAGCGRPGSTSPTPRRSSASQIRRVVDTNLLGSVNVIRAALPHLREQGRGRILQVSTAGGQATYPNFSYCHASKWGIEGFCETAAREIAPFGISLTIFEPGATPTGFGSALDTTPVMPESGPR
jgi:NAD(P)-dependent dehydrogenase (short-subunit alcohol dehydrogenase family)